MYMEDTPVEQLPERSQAAAKIQKEFGQIKFEDIKKDHDKRKSMLYFLAYSDFQPPLVNIMDVHLLEAKTKFEDRVNAVLGIAHVFYLYRSRSRKSRSVMWGLTRRVKPYPKFINGLAMNLAFRICLGITQYVVTKDVEKQIMEKYDLDSEAFKLGFEYMSSWSQLTVTTASARKD